MTSSRRGWTALWILCALACIAGVAWAQPEEGEPGALRNPLNPYAGSDPWLTYYDGYYYLAATTWTSDLLMRKSPTLAGLKTAIPRLIYHETEPSRCCNMWAPEFWRLEGEDGQPHWYLYYTAGASGTQTMQRMHVLESEGDDPMGPYRYKARIFDPSADTWSIDGSLLTLDDSLYYMFSSWVGDEQSLFIAPMSNPWTLSGPRVLIARPEHEWERIGLNVNEGPAALQHDGKTFIVYSASHCATPDYKLGLLELTGSDPLDPASWTKHPEPVFERSDENGIFGPGHNGFFMSPDGTEYWIVYHANTTVSGVCDTRRTTHVQQFTWNADGTPHFGVPVSTEAVIAAPSGDTGIDPAPEFEALNTSRFKSYAFDNAYLRRADQWATVTPLSEAGIDTEFYVLPGLADPEGISIMPVTLAGYFLRRNGRSVEFAVDDGTPEFAADATWYRRPGLADEAWISLESYAAPGWYIGKTFGIMALFELTGATTDVMREDATFLEE